MFMLLIFNICLIWGIYAATREDSIFNLENAPLSKWIANPLYNCPYCMSSIWGAFGFFIFNPETFGLGLWFLPLWILIIAGTNYLLLALITND